MGKPSHPFPLPESAASQSNALGELLHKIRGSESPGEVAASKNLGAKLSANETGFWNEEKASKWFRATPLIVDTRNACADSRRENLRALGANYG